MTRLTWLVSFVGACMAAASAPAFGADARQMPSVMESLSPPACGVGLVPEPPIVPLESVQRGPVEPDSAPAAGTTVDILIAYTTQAKDGAGGEAAMQDLISRMIDDANAVFVNSQIDVHLRLVHVLEVDYAESGSMPTDLSRLQNPTDGIMDEVHAARDTYGADLVCLLVHTGDYLGYAYITSTEASAFSVVGWGSAAAPSYIFAHEIGHNLGAGHARPVGPRGKYDYSYCYWDQGTPSQWRTVAASYGGALIPYFSNPNVLYNGQPIGVDSSDVAHSADNARTISLHAPIVAAFRNTVVAVPPAESVGLLRAGILLANHPNPFRRATAIPYELRERDRVSVTIVDIRGRKIRDLVGAIQGPGRFAADWDGRTEDGALVPSGIYLCRLEFGGYAQSRLVAFLR